jgi:recombinational DNA repair protein RecT
MMMSTITKQALTPREYRQLSTNIAKSLLVDWVGEDRAREAAGRISAALSAAAASARNPADFYACTQESIGRCVAIAALTEIMPGTGSTALAYLIPRRARKGESSQLQYQLSHRGLNALARRTGQTMIAVPISSRDALAFTEDGDVRVMDRDIDNPPTSEADLRGVIVLVREINSGATIVRGWVPASLINVRRDSSDAYTFACKKGNEWAKETDPWHQWYVEMAIKTAMHYAIGRGWCVIDDSAAVRAMSIDQEREPQLKAEVPMPCALEHQGENQMDDNGEIPLDDSEAQESPPDEVAVQQAAPSKRSKKTAPMFDPLAELPARLAECRNLNDIEDVRSDISHPDNALTDEQREALTLACGVRANALGV